MKKSETTKKAASRPARSAMAETTRENIALAAYSIWEQEGRPEGRDVGHWLQAEARAQATHEKPIHMS